MAIRTVRRYHFIIGQIHQQKTTASILKVSLLGRSPFFTYIGKYVCIEIKYRMLQGNISILKTIVRYEEVGERNINQKLSLETAYTPPLVSRKQCKYTYVYLHYFLITSRKQFPSINDYTKYVDYETFSNCEPTIYLLFRANYT